MRDECNCPVVCTFFVIAFLWDWDENWHVPVLWPLLSFFSLLTYWVQHFHSIIFRIWNSSAGISLPPLTLFVVMLPKANLTLHYRMSGSRGAITPLWLSGALRSYVYSSSVCSCHLFLISFASFCPLLFLSFHECSLGTLIFLKRSLVFPILFFSLYFFALVTEEGFFVCPCYSFNFMAELTIHSDFGAWENKSVTISIFPHLFSMKWWDRMPCLD